MGTYTVKKGNTLSEIAQKIGTTVAAIAGLNGIANPNIINVGQKIELPTSGSTGSSANSGYQYKTPAYVAPEFETSDETNKAYDNLNALTKPEAIDSSYEEAWKDAMDRINNREKFSYDLNGDALYQQYKDKYIQQGKMAMQDTMGQAAALTGGYGNSYAATAGNQAYQAHLNNLNDVIPELQQMAYERYKQEGQDLLNQYSMAKDVYDTKYGEYRDDMSQYNTDRSYLQSVYDSLYGRDYTMWNDDRTFGYGRHRDAISDEQWAAAMDYQKERDKVADAQWQKTYDATVKKNSVVDAVNDSNSVFGKDKVSYHKDGVEVSGDEPPKESKSDYADWDYGDWEAYFAYIRQTNGKAAAEKELSRMNDAGYIPKSFIVAASIGARGSLGH